MDSSGFDRLRSRRKRPKWEANMSDVEKLLSRERMLRLREAHLKQEAQRCHEAAAELRRAAWALQHREGSALLQDVLSDEELWA